MKYETIMKKKYLLLLLLIFNSCSNNDEKVVSGIFNTNIRGLIDFQTADEIEINNFIKRIDSLCKKNNDSESISSSKYYHNLLKHKLIRTPSIYLTKKDNSELQVFINNNQYQKIKKYDYLGSSLDYIINIKLKYKKIDEDILLSDSIIEVNVKRLKK